MPVAQARDHAKNRHVAVLLAIAAMLGDLALATDADDAVLRYSDDVGVPRVAGGNADGCAEAGPAKTRLRPEPVTVIGLPLTLFPDGPAVGAGPRIDVALLLRGRHQLHIDASRRASAAKGSAGAGK